MPRLNKSRRDTTPFGTGLFLILMLLLPSNSWMSARGVKHVNSALTVTKNQLVSISNGALRPLQHLFIKKEFHPFSKVVTISVSQDDLVLVKEGQQRICGSVQSVRVDTWVNWVSRTLNSSFIKLTSLFVATAKTVLNSAFDALTSR